MALLKHLVFKNFVNKKSGPILIAIIFGLGLCAKLSAADTSQPLTKAPGLNHSASNPEFMSARAPEQVAITILSPTDPTAKPTTQPAANSTAPTGLLRRVASASGGLVYSAASTVLNHAYNWWWRSHPQTTVSPTEADRNPTLSILSATNPELRQPLPSPAYTSPISPSQAPILRRSPTSLERTITSPSPPLLTGARAVVNSPLSSKQNLETRPATHASAHKPPVAYVTEHAPPITIAAPIDFKTIPRPGHAFAQVITPQVAIHAIIRTAAQYNNPEILHQYLTRLQRQPAATQKAILKACDQQGNTPLHAAVLMANPALVRLVQAATLELGLDQRQLRNHWGHRPYDLISDRYRTKPDPETVGTRYPRLCQTAYSDYVHASKTTCEQQIEIMYSLYPHIINDSPLPATSKNPTTAETIAPLVQAIREREEQAQQLALAQATPRIQQAKKLIAHDRDAQRVPDLQIANQNFREAQQWFNPKNSLAERLRTHKLSQIPKLLDRLT